MVIINIKKTLIIMGLLITPLISLRAAEIAKITAKELAVVANDHVVLGDIFEYLTPGQRKITIAPAPPPGKQTLYNASYLAQLAREHNLNWEPQSPFDQTIVRRQAQLVPHDILEQAILDKIDPYKKDDEVWKGRYRIEFSSAPNVYYSGQEPLHSLSVQNVQYNATTDRFRAMIITEQESQKPITHQLKGRLIRTIQVPVLTRVVEEQAPIAEDAIEWVEMAADRVGHDIVTDKKATRDMVAKHKLRAERVLRKKDLTPVLVKKDIVVNVVDENKNVMFEAKALEEGMKNTLIRLINLQNQQTIQGVVIDHQTVIISDSSQP